MQILNIFKWIHQLNIFMRKIFSFNRHLGCLSLYVAYCVCVFVLLCNIHEEIRCNLSKEFFFCLDIFSTIVSTNFHELSEAWYWENSAHVQHCLCKDSCSVESTFLYQNSRFNNHDKELLWGSNRHVLIMKLSKRTQLSHFQHFIPRTFLDNLLL